VDKPYRCGSGFFRRIGPNSQKLSRNEIIEFFKAEEKIRFDQLINTQFYYDEQVVNNTGILFFSKNLDYIYPHAAVTCALFQGTDKFAVLDRRDFNEDLISNIDGAMNFLKRYIAVRYEMTGEPRRKEIPEVPYDALREAIINAVAHRDYFERGANIMVEVYDDRIEISNPGGLPKGLIPAEFGKKSVLRNPKIAGMLHRADYIEKMGTGIRKMQRFMNEAGLLLLEFSFTSFFTVTFGKPAANGEKIGEVLSENFINKFGIKFGLKGNRLIRAVRILEILNGRERLIIPLVAESFEVKERAITRDIKFLKDNELVEFIGSPKKGWYVITEKGKKLISDLR
jgi:ATP-dependent DNA helicase RecG